MTSSSPAPGTPGMMRGLWRSAGPRRGAVLRGIVWRFVQSMCLGVPFAVLVWVLDQLRAGTMTAGQAWVAVGIVFAALIGQLVFGYLSVSASWLSSYQMVADMRLSLLDHLRKLPMGFHLARQQGDTVSTVTTDMGAVEDFAADGLPKIAQAAGLPLVVLLALTTVDPPMAAAAALSVLIAAPIFVLSNRWMRGLSDERQELQAGAASRMIEYIQGIGVIRAFNATAEHQHRFRASLEDFRAISLRMVSKMLPPLLLFATIAQLGVAVVLGAGTYWLFDGRIDATTMLTFLVLSLSIYAPLLQLIEVMEDLRLADASMNRINRVLHTPPQAEPAEPKEPSGTDIAFEHVRFSYQPGVPVLDDVSFSVPARSMTAIVGPSGSGKTTVLNLLGRFWDIDSGHIRIGGVDIRDMAVEQLYRHISVVFQDVYLFEGTIFDNIAFGHPDPSPEQVHRAAQAHEFITAFPDGYQTRVGEGGATLSGGERQRVSIARAILKDAPIVLLDEATASIDATNEKLVQQALTTLVSDKTLVVVAHKLATIRSADQILALEHGRVVERGTHDELLDADGLYARFWAERERAHGWRLTASAQ
ncbi:MAG: ATP-binding cassette domain-containing protein [Pseudonocardiaceae bacterium]|nr:ATP-binding cassette domain-containing protein [Pseudonocardiaceae bacterium]